MIAKQLSVFVENRKGRLGEVLDVLKKNDVNILSLSLADTLEYGLLRLIVDKPEVGQEKLTQAGFSTMIAQVLIVEIPHSPGSLQNLLQMVAEKEIDVEYMYGLSAADKAASVVIKTSDLQRAKEIFENN